jgi:hypothetical protein
MVGGYQKHGIRSDIPGGAQQFIEFRQMVEGR